MVAGSVAVVLFVSSRFLDMRPIRAYGFNFGRQWWQDFFGAIVIGFVFQGLVTVLFLQIGAGRLVGQFSSGVATGPLSIAIAFFATAVGFLSVALWEELLFRGVFIRNAIEGLAAYGATPQVAIFGAWLASILVFGLPHIAAVAAGASAYYALLQALLAGMYFGLAYLLTNSLAFPIGLHFATNFWVRAIVGQPESSFPTLYQMERTIQISWEVVAVTAMSAGVLIGLVLTWVYFTRGRISTPTGLTQLTGD